MQLAAVYLKTKSFFIVKVDMTLKLIVLLEPLS